MAGVPGNVQVVLGFKFHENNCCRLKKEPFGLGWCEKGRSLPGWALTSHHRDFLLLFQTRKSLSNLPRSASC